MAGLAQSDARTWTAVVAGCSAGVGVGVTLTIVSDETPEAVRRDEAHLRPLRQQVEGEPTTLVELHPLPVGGQRDCVIGEPAQRADVAGYGRNDLGRRADNRAGESFGAPQ